MKRWNAENKEWRRNWVNQNRDKLNQRASELSATPEGKRKKSKSFAKWRSQNLDKEKLRWKEWSSKNKDKIKARRLTPKYRAAHAASARRRYQKVKNDPSFQLKNRARAKAGKGKRRALEFAAPVEDVKLIRSYIRRMKSKPSVKCYYCGSNVSGPEVHIDHIIPIAKGGPHAVGNLCCACSCCNLRKNDAMPNEFADVLAL